MSRAKAICKCATCGNEFTKIAYKSNSREADSWEKWAVENFDECDECREKRIRAAREKENEKSAKEAKEVNLPELTGSEKQIAWAETIRMKIYKENQDVIDGVMKRIQMLQEEKPEKVEKTKKQLDEMISFGNWILKKEDSRFWIDNRGNNIRDLYMKYRNEFQAEIPEEIEEEIKNEEVVLEPENKTSTVCEVKATEEEVTVKTSQKDPTVIDIVKKAGYRWNGVTWKKNITVTTGSADERLIEISNRLLTAGISVKVRAEYKQRIVAGEYEPETTRWITCMTDDPDHVYIRDLEDEARKITGASRYKTPVKVPVSSWEEVMDFARVHDYKISEGAEKVMQAYRDKITKVSATKGADAEYKEENTKEILNSSRDILEDLKEED